MSDIINEVIANITGGGSGGDLVDGTEVNYSDCANNDPVPFTRFILIFAIASVISLVGFVSNIILGISLMWPAWFTMNKKVSKKFPTPYLTALSILDASICLCYVMIMGGDALALFLRWEALYLAWVYYGIPMFTISRIVQLASSYVIVAATSERLFLILSEKRGRRKRAMTSYKVRASTISIILLLSFVFRVVTVFELEISYFDCHKLSFSVAEGEGAAFGSVAIQQKEFTFSGHYYYYDFYFISFIQVFLPFGVLGILNFFIIRSLKRRYVDHEFFRRGLPNRLRDIYRDKFFRSKLTTMGETSPEKAKDLGGIRRIIEEAEHEAAEREIQERRESEMAPLAVGVAVTSVYLHRMANQRERQVDKRSVNSATYTFIWIAASYTFCNSLSIFIGIMERLPNKPWLTEFSQEYGRLVPNRFYVVTTDVISFLFMFCSFLRPIIYVKFNTRITIDWPKHFRRSIH